MYPTVAPEPYLTDRLYRVRKLEESAMPWLHQALANVCERTRIGIRGPRLTPTEFKEPVAVIEPDENRTLP